MTSGPISPNRSRRTFGSSSRTKSSGPSSRAVSDSRKPPATASRSSSTTPVRRARKPTFSSQKRFLPMTKSERRKALGKGLHSLLPTRSTAPAPDPAAPLAEGDVHRLPIAHITPNPNQPRRDFDEAGLLELSQSIEREGIIQPIIVRRVAALEYQIIAGERRWRAAKLAGLEQVPVIVRTAHDQQVLVLGIAENIQRADVTHLERA